ncbi:MAG: toll/interleukin-1 receptor domain-containing protein [Gammaproteobacteria bacterium]|nr:toll/interleukin-1 receptor domain-containing protein [Gammaproteobacteria bacterium]
MKYRAFISYSHHDRTFAGWLHKQLERYTLPRNLKINKSDVKGRTVAPVFLDTEEFGGAPSLTNSVVDALRASDTLLVIATENSISSEWVKMELTEFRRQGKGHRILPIRPGNASKDVISHPSWTSDEVKLHAEYPSDQPLFVQFGPTWRENNAALLKIIAFILGIRYDDLAQRARKRRNRRLSMLAAGAVGLLVLMTYVWQEMEQRRWDQLRADSIALTSAAERDIQAGRYGAAIPKLISALPDDPEYENRPIVITSESLLSKALYLSTATATIRSSKGVSSSTFDETGQQLRVYTSDGNAYSVDLMEQTVSRDEGYARSSGIALGETEDGTLRLVWRGDSLQKKLVRQGPAGASVVISNNIVQILETKAGKQILTVEAKHASTAECESLTFSNMDACLVTLLVVVRDWDTGAISFQQDLQTKDLILACHGAEFLLLAPRNQLGMTGRITIFTAAKGGYERWKVLQDVAVDCHKDRNGFVVAEKAGGVYEISKDEKGAPIQVELSTGLEAGRQLKPQLATPDVLLLKSGSTAGQHGDVTFVFLREKYEPWTVKNVSSYGISTDGKYLAVLSRDGVLYVRFRDKLLAEISLFDRPLLASELVFSEDTNLLAVSVQSESVTRIVTLVVDPWSEEVLTSFETPYDRALGSRFSLRTQFSPSSDLVSVTGSEMVVVHRTRPEQPETVVETAADSIVDHRLISEAQLAVLTESGLKVFELSTNELLFEHPLPLKLDYGQGLAQLFGGEERIIAVNHRDGYSVFDSITWRHLWDARAYRVDHIDIASRLMLVAAVSKEGVSEYTLYKEAKPDPVFQDHSASKTKGCRLTATGSTAYCFSDKTLVEIPAETGQIAAQRTFAQPICAVYPLFDGQQLAVFTFVKELPLLGSAYSSAPVLRSRRSCRLSWWRKGLVESSGVSLPESGYEFSLFEDGRLFTSDITESNDQRFLIVCEEATCQVSGGPDQVTVFQVGPRAQQSIQLDAVIEYQDQPTLYILAFNGLAKYVAGQSQPVIDVGLEKLENKSVNVSRTRPLALLNGRRLDRTVVALVDTDVGNVLWSNAKLYGEGGHLSDDAQVITVADVFGVIELWRVLPIGGRELIELAKVRAPFEVSLDFL